MNLQFNSDGDMSGHGVTEDDLQTGVGRAGASAEVRADMAVQARVDRRVSRRPGSVSVGEGAQQKATGSLKCRSSSAASAGLDSLKSIPGFWSDKGRHLLGQ